MKSVVYIEEEYIAGLLKDYFSDDTGTTYIAADASTKRRLKARNQEVFLAGRNNSILREEVKKDGTELLLIQSDDFDKVKEVLDTVEAIGSFVPTLVITSQQEQISAQYNFVHCITMQQLLESNIRWHIVLAKTHRKLQTIQQHFKNVGSVLILLQDDPDPDAIASGLALRQVLGRNKQTATIGTFGQVTRPENIAMVKLLEIKIETVNTTTIKAFDRIALVDLQPSHINASLPRLDLVVDHHPAQFDYETVIKDVRPTYGATATILLEYLLSERDNVGTRLATALLYGIKSDTFILAREASEWDVEAFSYLYRRANQNLLRRIERPELPPAALDALSRAIKGRKIQDKAAFINLGQVEREDLIPQIADFCLQFEGAEWSVTSGIYKSNLIISVRNIGNLRSAGKLVKEAFGTLGSAGGHASMAKAIIPTSKLSEKWKTDVRDTHALNSKIQQSFLKALRVPR